MDDAIGRAQKEAIRARTDTAGIALFQNYQALCERKEDGSMALYVHQR